VNNHPPKKHSKENMRQVFQLDNISAIQVIIISDFTEKDEGATQ